MTKEEILAMEAGRELDGLVAKEIMGIEVEYPFAEGYPYYLREDKDDKRKKWDIVALYSTDILAAWQVVEKMVKEGYYFGLYTVVEDDKIKWDCSISKEEMGELTTPLLEYEFAPEAICKAALLAKLEEAKNV